MGEDQRHTNTALAETTRRRRIAVKSSRMNFWVMKEISGRGKDNIEAKEVYASGGIICWIPKAEIDSQE